MAPMTDLNPHDQELVKQYRIMGYWYAVGQSHGAGLPDWSIDFGDWAADRRAAFARGGVTHLPSIPDMWTEFLNTTY